MSTPKTNINIQHHDNRFQKDAIKGALQYTHDQKANSLGKLYDDLFGPGMMVTTYFHANGWYHITHVEAETDEDEQRFWNDLTKIVQENPSLFNPA